MGDYIHARNGVNGAEATLTLNDASGTYTLDPAMVVAALQDFSLGESSESFDWTQLDSAAKKRVVTTVTNEISGSLALNYLQYVGIVASGGVAVDGVADAGLHGMVKDKIKISFTLYSGDQDDGTAGVTWTGNGYLSNLQHTMTGENGVWFSTFTILVDGDMTVA